MDNILLNTFTPTELILAGLCFIAIETIMLRFLVFWLGLSLVIVGLISFFFEYSDGVIQIFDTLRLTILMAFLLRKRALEKFHLPDDGDHS